MLSSTHTTVLQVLLPTLYGLYQLLVALFIQSYLPTLPLAALSSSLYAVFATCMGILGAVAFRLRSPSLLLVFSHHLVLDAIESMVPSVIALDFIQRSAEDICNASYGRSDAFAFFTGSNEWCKLSATGARAGFAAGAIALVATRIGIAMTVRRVAIQLEPTRSYRSGELERQSDGKAQISTEKPMSRL
ncbi:hypothetical protein ANO11243_052210 [Dothideomycetidae sp. 11243]|nr:hypothetical protein ANO11243_052210 [fungal sp. No.11243]